MWTWRREVDSSYKTPHSTTTRLTESNLSGPDKSVPQQPSVTIAATPTPCYSTSSIQTVAATNSVRSTPAVIIPTRTWSSPVVSATVQLNNCRLLASWEIILVSFEFSKSILQRYVQKLTDAWFPRIRLSILHCVTDEQVFLSTFVLVSGQMIKYLFGVWTEYSMWDRYDRNKSSHPAVFHNWSSHRLWKEKTHRKRRKSWRWQVDHVYHHRRRRWGRAGNRCGALPDSGQPSKNQQEVMRYVWSGCL